MASVLLIDDDMDFTDAAAIVLKKKGYDVRVLNNTDGALDEIRNAKPDVVVLDVMFPENSSAGFELALVIRKDETLKDLPILILSAVNTRFPLGFGPKDIDKTWMPVQDFLEKPIDFDVLLERVQRLVAAAAG